MGEGSRCSGFEAIPLASGFSWQQAAHFGELWGRKSFAGASKTLPQASLSLLQPKFESQGLQQGQTSQM